MKLSAFASEKRLAIFEELSAGQEPSEGSFDEHVLKEGKTKGKPQMGSTRFEPDTILFEFIFPEAAGASTVLTVRVSSPERIVFMPVPDWVVENIWQGDVTGSFMFESEARAAVEGFNGELTSETNPKWFLPQAAKRRE